MVGKEEGMAENKSVWNRCGIREVIQYSLKRWPNDEEVISMVRTYWVVESEMELEFGAGDSIRGVAPR